MIKLAQLGPRVVFSTLWVQNLVKIALSLFLKYTIFSISTKIQDGGRNMEKSNFFRYAREVVLGNLGGPKFARNCSISYGF